MRGLGYIFKIVSTPLKNISYLAATKAVDVFSGIVVYVFLLQNVDSIKYAEYVYYTAMFSFLVPFFSLSLDVSGVNFVRKNDNQVSRDFYYFLLVKRILIFLPILLVINLILLSIGKSNILLVNLSSWPLVWALTYPSWLYLGMQKYKALFQATLFSKGLWCLFVIIFWDHFNSLNFVAFLALLSSLLVFVYVLLDLGWRDIRKLPFSLVHFISENWQLFASQIFTSCYTSLNRILVGSLLGLQSLFIYDFTEKIYTFLKLPSTTILQFMFSKIDNIWSVLFKLRYSFYFLSGVIIFTLFVYVLGDRIVSKVIGDIKSQDIMIFFNIQLIIYLVTSFSGVLSTLFILHTKALYRNYFRAIIAGGIFFLSSIFFLNFLKVISLSLFYYFLLGSEILILIIFIYIAYENTRGSIRSNQV